MEQEEEYVPTVDLPKRNVKAMMRRFIADDTQVTDDAVTNLQNVLVEFSRWIIIKAEKLARRSGTVRITQQNIRDATKMYMKSKEDE